MFKLVSNNSNIKQQYNLYNIWRSFLRTSKIHFCSLQFQVRCCALWSSDTAYLKYLNNQWPNRILNNLKTADNTMASAAVLGSVNRVHHEKALDNNWLKPSSFLNQILFFSVVAHRSPSLFIAQRHAQSLTRSDTFFHRLSPEPSIGGSEDVNVTACREQTRPRKTRH